VGELGTGAAFDLFPDTGLFSSGPVSVAAEAWAALDAEVAATKAAEERSGRERAASARAAERDAARQLSATVPADVVEALTAALAVVDTEVPLGGPAVVAPTLLARVRGLAQLANVVDTALAHAVRAAENAQAAEFDGHKTMRAWLPGHLNVSPATASRIVRAGRTLEQLPTWDAAASAGRITPDQTTTVSKVATPARLAAAADMGVGVTDLDAELTACATGPTPDTLGPVVKRALDWIDPDGPEPDPTRRRELHLDHDAGTLHGRLDPVGFEKLATALTAYQQAGRTQDDQRSHAQQMADALVQLTDNALAAATTPVLRGNRAHVAVTIDAEDLLDPDTVTDAARLGSGQQVSNETARHIACDSASPASCSARTACRSTSAAPNAWSPPTSAAPPRPATAAASSPPAPTPPGGATPTTSPSGSPTTARPASRTPPCSANATTPRSTTATPCDGTPTTTAGAPSDPTATRSPPATHHPGASPVDPQRRSRTDSARSPTPAAAASRPPGGTVRDDRPARPCRPTTPARSTRPGSPSRGQRRKRTVCPGASWAQRSTSASAT